MTRRSALWASTAANGGISTFVEAVCSTSLSQKWNIEVVKTHDLGSLPSRVLTFCSAVQVFISRMLWRRPDVVHLHVSHYGSFFRKLILSAVAGAFRVPIILHIHGSKFGEFYDMSPRAVKFAIRVTLEKASLVIALGDLWAKRIREIAPNANVVSLPNAVRPFAAVDQYAGSNVHVIFLGEIGERKGAFLLLQAWAAMATKFNGYPPARLTMAGDGAVDTALHMVQSLGLSESVEIRGWINRSEVVQLIRSAHVLTLPSQNEGQPMAILEAMANGLCIIATDVGGIPEMLGNDSGMLIAPNNPEQLAECLLKAISSARTREEFGIRAVVRVKQLFNLDVLASQLDWMYHEVVRQSKHD